MMKSIKCALIEGHSWPSVDDPTQHLFGFRNYTFEIVDSDYLVSVDILGPADHCPDIYHYYLIADELATSPLPLFIPYANRVALLKESPRFIKKLNVRRMLKTFPVIITNLASFFPAVPKVDVVPFSSNFLGVNPSRSNFLLAPPVAKTKLCSMIANLGHDATDPGYSFRSKVYGIASCSRFVDMYGLDSNPLDFKIDGLTDYMFSISMENCREDFYFTEKLVDCFLTGVIPVYWGCPSVGEFFDSRGILSFNSIDEFPALLSSLSANLYRQMMPYAEKNMQIAFTSEFADYEGYLKRVLSRVLARSKFQPVPFKMERNLLSKLKSKIRRLRFA